MKVFSVHLRERRGPAFVREGFSFGALLFGPLWFAFAGAWIPAALLLALDLGVAAAPLGAPLGTLRPAIAIAVAVLTGLLARDALRWNLALRGYTLAHVVAARGEDEAFARLLDARPDLVTADAGR